MRFFRVFAANEYFCQVRTTASTAQKRIILGIDPGTNVLGYGLLSVCGKQAEMIAMGVIDAFHPDELAIEAPFFGKNVQSMLKLGRAQGVVIAAAIARQIPIHEYAPTQIKQAITGRGAASKEQVAALMQRMLNIADERMLPYLDATDALAAAYCHHIHTTPQGVRGRVATAQSAMAKTLKTNVARGTGASWNDFVKQNAHRVRHT